MGLGPVYSSAKALEKAGLALEDMDVIEFNEAFAAQVLACVRASESDDFGREKLGRKKALGKIDMAQAQPQRRRDRARPPGRGDGLAPAAHGRARADREEEALRARDACASAADRAARSSWRGSEHDRPRRPADADQRARRRRLRARREARTEPGRDRARPAAPHAGGVRPAALARPRRGAGCDRARRPGARPGDHRTQHQAVRGRGRHRRAGRAHATRR